MGESGVAVRVLLAPLKGDEHGLLAEGPCGARPPMAWYVSRAQIVPVSVADDLPGVQTLSEGWHPLPSVHCYTSGRQALVLAWDGEVVPEGLDRAARRWEAVTEESSRGLERYDLWWCRLVDAINLGHECQEHGLGTLLLFDAEGREVVS